MYWVAITGSWVYTHMWVCAWVCVCLIMLVHIMHVYIVCLCVCVLCECVCVCVVKIDMQITTLVQTDQQMEVHDSNNSCCSFVWPLKWRWWALFSDKGKLNKLSFPLSLPLPPPPPSLSLSLSLSLFSLVHGCTCKPTQMLKDTIVSTYTKRHTNIAYTTMLMWNESAGKRDYFVMEMVLVEMLGWADSNTDKQMNRIARRKGRLQTRWKQVSTDK